VSTWFTIATILVSAVVSIDVVLNKQRPVSAVLWLGVVWSFPLWGAVAYGIFGIDRIRRSQPTWQDIVGTAGSDTKLSREVRKAIEGYSAAATPLAEVPAAHVFEATEPAVRQFRVTSGNRAEFLLDGSQFYPAIWEAIDAARTTVHVQSYIIRRDHVGRDLVQRLEVAARRGVQVRVLYDRFGSAGAHYSGLLRRLRSTGAEVRASRTWGHLNLRNHRKVSVIDGHTAFVGGMNFDGRNLPQDPAIVPDRDYHALLRGPAVNDLQLQFLGDWSSARRTGIATLDIADPFPAPDQSGHAWIQIVPGGPDREGTGLAKAYFGAIASAEESVTLVTPYFLPDDPILEAMRYTAWRGGEVRVVLPARSNHWYTTPAARSLYAPLLRAGVRIFERTQPFIHAKALLVDGVYAMLGSANLDYRSLHLNFELNVEVAEAEFVSALGAQLDREVAASREITLEEHEARALTTRLSENFFRLFQPIM